MERRTAERAAARIGATYPGLFVDAYRDQGCVAWMVRLYEPRSRRTVVSDTAHAAEEEARKLLSARSPAVQSHALSK